MAEDGMTNKELYERCCSKALTESFLSGKFLETVYGYKRTNMLIRDVYNGYRGRKKLDDAFLANLDDSLKKDLDNDLYLNGMMRYSPDSYESGRGSMERTFNTIIETLGSISDDYDEQLRFVLYFLGVTATNDPFDFKKLEINRNRMLKADNPYDRYPALKDQFQQMFEDIYRPCARDFANVISRYPGFDNESAYRTIEVALSIETCYEQNGDYKSDIREMRNSLGHEKYRIGEKISLEFRDGSIREYNEQEMMYTVSMIPYKCMFMNMMLPVMNIEILRSMEHGF